MPLPEKREVDRQQAYLARSLRGLDREEFLDYSKSGFFVQILNENDYVDNPFQQSRIGKIFLNHSQRQSFDTASKFIRHEPSVGSRNCYVPPLGYRQHAQCGSERSSYAE